MKKTIISILGIIIFAAISMVANGQAVTPPLPQLIQNLSDEDYTTWAQWQNRQAIRRAEKTAEYTEWERYNYADRVVSGSFSHGSATTRTTGTSNSTSKSSARSGQGWSNRSNSHSTTRNGYANTNISRIGGTTTTSYQIRYLNPDYKGPGSIVIYNPWVRLEGGLGTPNWGSLFVPCKDNTITMQEVLDRLIGPKNPEKVFKIMMEGYFGG